MTAVRIAMFTLLAVATPALAQTPKPAASTASGTVVYKCTNPDGSVIYSQTPCSSDPSKVQTLDTAPALRTGSGGYQAEISAGVADSDCRDQAYKSTHADAAQIAESKRHVSDYQQRRQLMTQPGYADPGAPDNAKALADLDAAIAAEHQYQDKITAGNEAAYQDALRRCDEALRKSTQPAAPATPPKGKEGG